jgi:hypothetical protein
LQKTDKNDQMKHTGFEKNQILILIVTNNHRDVKFFTEATYITVHFKCYNIQNSFLSYLSNDEQIKIKIIVGLDLDFVLHVFVLL